MRQELSEAIASACYGLFGDKPQIELSRPDEKFGDFSTNVALKLAAKLGKNPRQIAETIAGKLEGSETFRSVDIAGPGFINFTLSDHEVFSSMVKATKPHKSLAGRSVVTEYSDPNPFKVLHVGHLYTSVVGDAISNILEAAGAEVHRVNYGGDGGLHVAKTLRGVLDRIGGENPGKLEGIKQSVGAGWLSECYIKGTGIYEEDTSAKQAIMDLNKRIYKISLDNDKDSDLAKIYWLTRMWSYEYFDEFYKRINIRFEKYYPESSVAQLGLQTVKQHLPAVYSESEGAVVYKAEDKGLHTRVFITKEGLPTYEAKEVGLMLQKKKDYHFDKSIIITANEQSQYMQVVLASIEEYEPDLVKKTDHLTHGMVKLPGSEKMSSRKGNIIKAVDILELAEKYARKINDAVSSEIVIGAVKYSFLKTGLGGDIIYDAKESVTIEGNSGPYLQYALVRAKSILAKADNEPIEETPDELNPTERSLARKISMYPEVFTQALEELSPHHICTYLYELAQSFNRFYETNRVINDERSAFRLAMVDSYSKVLKSGLDLLGIRTPDKM